MLSRLKKELGQTKPFSSPHEAVFLGIQKIADWQQGEFNDLFKAKGLTGSQYNVLRILRGAGKDGLSCGKIGERMINRESDITRMLDRLEAGGLITRKRKSDDRRVVQAYIAKQGLKLLAELDEPVRELHKTQLRHLNKREIESLIKLLGKAWKETS